MPPSIGLSHRPAAPTRRLRHPSPPSVLLVVDSLEGGGAERYVVDLATALRHRGWPVEVACSVSGVREGALREAQVPVHVLRSELVKRRVSLGYGRALRRLVRDRDYALVHAHLYASAAAAVHATAGRDLPLVLTEHTEGPWRGARARAASRLVYRRAAHVVAVSSAIRRLLVEGFGVPEERTEVLLPAVVTSAAPRTRSAAAPPTVGLVARLVPDKGGDVFLRAAAMVRRVVPQARFLVVGDGPERDRLQRQAAAAGLADAVAFLGFRHDAPELIAGLDVLVVPSRSDGTPLVVAEAMAAAVPVVASAVGGLPDLVRPQETGLLVRPGDVDDLARALVSLLLDPVAARALGDGGRARVSGCPHERLVDRMTQVYTRLAPAVR